MGGAVILSWGASFFSRNRCVHSCLLLSMYTDADFAAFFSPTEFKCARMGSSVESDRGSLLNALNIVGREEQMVRTSLRFKVAMLISHSAAIIHAVVYILMIFTLWWNTLRNVTLWWLISTRRATPLSSHSPAQLRTPPISTHLNPITAPSTLMTWNSSSNMTKVAPLRRLVLLLQTPPSSHHT